MLWGFRWRSRLEGLTGSVADGCVEGSANHGDIVVLIGLDQTLDRLQVGEAGDAGEGPLDSLVRWGGFFSFFSISIAIAIALIHTS